MTLFDACRKLRVLEQVGRPRVYTYTSRSDDVASGVYLYRLETPDDNEPTHVLSALTVSIKLSY